MRNRARVSGFTALLVVVALVASGCIFQGSWASIPVTPAPPAGVTLDSDFNDVSCPTDEFCMAVGADLDDGDTFTEMVSLAQTWDGTTWTDIPYPGSTGPVIDEETVVAFRGAEISCATSTMCITVAEQFFESEGSGDTFYRFYRWNGTTWTIMSMPWGTGIEEQYDVSCASDGACIAVSYELGDFLVYDGVSWSDIENAWSTPGRGNYDCGSASFCVVLSSEFATHWDGTAATFVALPQDGSLTYESNAVDCTADDHCLSVGSWQPGGAAAAAVWDGSSWSSIAANPQMVSPGQVSCSSSLECAALDGLSTFAWNGTKWVRKGDAPGGVDTTYTAISCAGTACMAVGWDGPEAGSEAVSALFDWPIP